MHEKFIDEVTYLYLSLTLVWYLMPYSSACWKIFWVYPNFFDFTNIFVSSKSKKDLIASPSPSVKIQNMGGIVCLRCKGKTFLVVKKLFIFKSLLTTPSNVLTSHLKQTFLLIIWIFNEDEGERNEFRLPFYVRWCRNLDNLFKKKFSWIDFPLSLTPPLMSRYCT